MRRLPVLVFVLCGFLKVFIGTNGMARHLSGRVGRDEPRSSARALPTTGLRLDLQHNPGPAGARPPDLLSLFKWVAKCAPKSAP
jgi:hypothetical protein